MKDAKFTVEIFMSIITFQWFTQLLRGSLQFTTLPGIVDAYITFSVDRKT